MATLLKEQVDLLEERINKLKKQKKELIESKVGSVTRIEENSTGDINYQANLEIQKIANEISEINSILNNGKVIEKVSNHKIDIGTVFTATIDFEGDLETDNYMLVEKKVNHIINNDVNVISIESPFGKSVVGKKENEFFSYETSDDITIKGTINIIGKDKIEEKAKQKVK